MPEAFICDFAHTPFGRYGGAIVIGHPLGASGARIAMTAVNALETLGGPARDRHDVQWGWPGHRLAD